jgi:hypothetical protein
MPPVAQIKPLRGYLILRGVPQTQQPRRDCVTLVSIPTPSQIMLMMINFEGHRSIKGGHTSLHVDRDELPDKFLVKYYLQTHAKQAYDVSLFAPRFTSIPPSAGASPCPPIPELDLMS